MLIADGIASLFSIISAAPTPLTLSDDEVYALCACFFAANNFILQDE
ncbi:MAG TPA: hypothetical protein VMA30_16420 [Xanthobacteraceae bacterium]|nr:hypothetical protein [Xanthobacteraceae bacterium]